MAHLGFLTLLRKFSGRKLLLSGVIVSALMFIFCTTSTTFRVLDAETKEPIEGAVALAEWTRTGGLPGLSVTKTAKAVEAVSDSEVFFTIPGTIGTLALQTPLIKIY